MVKHTNLIYALKDGEITSICDAPSGLKCGCICPACGAKLVARKGQKRMHHFAHHADENCEYGYESSLHLAAKDILSSSQKMIIPPVCVHFPKSAKKDELVNEEIEIELDHVELEKRFDDVIPDIVAYAGGKFFFIEIFVTHPISEEKLTKLKELDISTIEIDLSGIERSISAEELSEILLKSDPRKAWRYNSVANRWYQRFISVSDKKTITARGFALHVDGCPIAIRKWNGKPYANYIDDCCACKYCVSYGSSGEILCSGKKRISAVADFSLPESIRISNSNAQISEKETQSFANGRCPNCGWQLVKKHSSSGEIWKCSRFPHCRFTAFVDPRTGEVKMKA